MRVREIPTTLFLALSLSLLPSAGSAAPEDVVLEVNEFRMTRAQFDQRFGGTLGEKEGHGVSGIQARKFWLAYVLRGRLLALYADRHILKDDLFWAAAEGNMERAMLAESWLERRFGGLGKVEDREEMSLRLAEELEKSAGVRRNLPLFGDGGVPPSDQKIVAEVGTTKIPFLRIRAVAAGSYEAFATWPAGQSEETLRSALERLVRVELMARAFEAESGSPAAPASIADRLQAWKVGVAQGKAGHEAGLPDPSLAARLEELERNRSVLLPVFVTVYRGTRREDLEAISGGPSETGRSPGTARGGIDTLKFGGTREYWLQRGAIPPVAEKAALDMDSTAIPGFTGVIAGDGAFYVVYVRRRGDPPLSDPKPAREKVTRDFRKQKYDRIIEEMIEKARGENHVVIHEDRI